MSKRRFVTLPHNQFRNTTTNLLTDVRVEPQLQTLSGETFSGKTANKSDQDRVDVSARELWLGGQVALFDVRLFNPTPKRYANYEIRKSYKVNEKEKKKQYNDRILPVEHGTFTPLVIFVTGDVGRESRTFYARL